MRTSALLFLVIGLAVGLWLGFNPTTHRDLARWWNRETSGRTERNLGISQLNSRLTRSLQSSPKPLAKPGAQTDNVPTASQIGSELHTFWLALERIWLSFLARLHLR